VIGLNDYSVSRASPKYRNSKPDYGNNQDFSEEKTVFHLGNKGWDYL